MTNDHLKRILAFIPMLFGISVISYAIIRFAPGDPARMLADPELLSAEQMEIVRQQLGLDEPIVTQFFKTMGALFTGDLQSFRTRQPVLEVMGERLPTTAILAVLTLVFGFVFGTILGVVQAIRPKSRLDDIASGLSLFGFAVPSFWLALMLIMVFAVRLDWFPASGIRPANATGWNLVEMAPYLVLPTIVLGTNLLASVARYTRSSMIESLSQDYIRTARSKGLRERLVIVRHALRNSLLPSITLFGVQLPYLIGGSVAVETIFALPGIGRLALDSVIARDYPVILTINVLVATLVLVGNFLSDIVYGVADPRIRTS